MSRKATLILIAAGIGLAGAAWFLARSLGPSRQVTIGIARWVANEESDRNILAFKAALANASFVERKNTTFLIRNAGGDVDKQKDIINLFVRRKVDLIYSLGTPGTLIAKELVPGIPIVFSTVPYPVEAGIIASSQHSGNNLVGARSWVDIEHQLAVFREIVPRARIIAIVRHREDPNSIIQQHRLELAGDRAGIKILDVAVRTLAELRPALEEINGKVDALYSACNTLVQGGGEEIIIAFAKANKLPDFTCNKSGVFKGSLVATIADVAQIGELAGEKAAAILRGAVPTSLETTTVARPFIYINQKTADVLGLAIPADLLTRAREVIH